MVSAGRPPRCGMVSTALSLALSCALVHASPTPPSAEDRLRLGPEDQVSSLRNRLAHPTSDDTIVIAHRGCWKETSENSIAAVRACIRMGVDGVEFDVRHSSDGVAVVIHDETVDRMTNGHGKVSALSLAQLKALRLKVGDGKSDPSLTDETIPTLDEFLTAARGRLLLVFDVKDLTQAASFAQARADGVDRQAIFFYECADNLLLEHIRSFWNDVIVFPITFGNGPPLAQSLASCPSTPADMVHAKFGEESTVAAPAAQQALIGKRVWVATMFSQEVAGHSDAAALRDADGNWGWLLRHGANMIMTNEPAALLGYLRDINRRRASAQPTLVMRAPPG